MLFEFSVESLRDLLAKMKHNNHNHVFICVQSPETKNHYHYIYRGSKSSSIKPTVAQDRQTKHRLQRRALVHLVANIEEGERDIQLVLIHDLNATKSYKLDL